MQDENRFIWELAPIGLAKVNASGRFVAVNQRYCEITGYSETELLRKTFQEITHPDDLAADVAEAAHLSEGDADSYQMVKRYISKDGRTVWISLHVNAVRESGGQFILFLVFAIELLHINLNNSHSPGVAQRQGGDHATTIWNYVKANPKEAAAIGASIVAIAQGRNIVELLLPMIFKQ